jgi:hypothetical protein
VSYTNPFTLHGRCAECGDEIVIYLWDDDRLLIDHFQLELRHIMCLPVLKDGQSMTRSCRWIRPTPFAVGT